jgi:hypothetical protein
MILALDLSFQTKELMILFDDSHHFTFDCVNRICYSRKKETLKTNSLYC